MSGLDAISVRPWRAGDEQQLVELFRSVFDHEIDERHWRWKLARRYPGAPQAANVILATSEERPVFQYAGIPTRFVRDGLTTNMIVSVDTMTAPDFRRRGLLTRVASDAYARWGAAGFDFVLGLPNEQWGSRATALGWQQLLNLRWLAHPLRPEAVLAYRLRQPWMRRVTFLSTLWNGVLARQPKQDPSLVFVDVSVAGDEFDQLWLRTGNACRFGVVRDRAWVQWRFLDCPSRAYRVVMARRGSEPVGYCAWREEDKGRRTAFLAELHAADSAARDALLAHLFRRLRDVAMEFVATLAVPGSVEGDHFRARSFFAGPAFSVQLVPLAANLPLEDLRNVRNWQLSGAAFDVI